MTYAIAGLPRETFATSFAMNDEELAKNRARRMVADADGGFPCRIALADVGAGERVILLNYVSHDVPGPFHTAYAIYVGERSAPPAPFVDAVPDYLDGRVLSLRAFASDGLIVTAVLAQPGTADGAIRLLFADTRVAYVMAHFAAYGCFAARIERQGDKA